MKQKKETILNSLSWWRWLAHFFLINLKNFTTLFGIYFNLTLESYFSHCLLTNLTSAEFAGCSYLCLCEDSSNLFHPCFTWQNRRRDIPAKSPSRIVSALAWYLPGSCNHVFVTTHFSVPYAPSIMEYAWTRLAQILAETKCFQNSFVVHPPRSCFIQAHRASR